MARAVTSHPSGASADLWGEHALFDGAALKQSQFARGEFEETGLLSRAFDHVEAQFEQSHCLGTSCILLELKPILIYKSTFVQIYIIAS